MKLSNEMLRVLRVMSKGVCVSVGMVGHMSIDEPETAYWAELGRTEKQPRPQTIRALQARGLVDTDGGFNQFCRITEKGKSVLTLLPPSVINR